MSEVAKYDWKQLEKEYILSDCKSVSSFLKDKGINNNSYARNSTKGWKEKKRQNSDKIVTKTIEKVTEKQSEKEAQQIVDIKGIATDLATNLQKATEQLEKYIVKSKGKTKRVTYDLLTNKITSEVIEENEGIAIIDGIVDTKKLKELSSALKDINDILNDRKEDNNTGNNYEDYLKKVERK